METGFKVGDAMTRSPITVDFQTSVLECAKLMREHKVGSLVLQDDGEVRGIITENDMVRRCLAKEKDPRSTNALDLASEHVITIAPDVDIFEAIRKMMDYEIRHLPVVHNGNMVGFVTVKDILRIEPQLFEILREKIEVREEERKLRELEEHTH